MKPAPPIVPRRREPSGRAQRISKAQREAEQRRVADIIGVAMKNPDRRAFGDRARDPLTGYPLGRLMLHGIISPDDHAAGIAYEGLYRVHSYMVGTTRLPDGSTIGALMVAAGLSCVVEPDDEAIAAIRRKWSAVSAELRWCGMDARLARHALDAVCIRGEHESTADLDALKAGLCAVRLAIM